MLEDGTAVSRRRSNCLDTGNDVSTDFDLPEPYAAGFSVFASLRRLRIQQIIDTAVIWCIACLIVLAVIVLV